MNSNSMDALNRGQRSRMKSPLKKRLERWLRWKITCTKNFKETIADYPYSSGKIKAMEDILNYLKRQKED